MQLAELLNRIRVNWNDGRGQGAKSFISNKTLLPVRPNCVRSRQRPLFQGALEGFEMASGHNRHPVALIPLPEGPAIRAKTRDDLPSITKSPKNRKNLPTLATLFLARL